MHLNLSQHRMCIEAMMIFTSLLRLVVIAIAFGSIFIFGAAKADELVGAKWVPIQVDDITIVVPSPFKVGRPDQATDCKQSTISDAAKFNCTFLTDAIWRHANNAQNVKLPYVEYNAEYSPGVPYPGPLLRGEVGTPNWRPFFNTAGYLDGFTRYYNGGQQYRYVPWSPTLVDTSCQYALDFGGTPSPRCHPNGLRSQMLAFGWQPYGPDSADPTNRYSGTTMLEVLDIVNQQQLGNFALGVDQATGIIGPVPGRAVTWGDYGRISYFRPDGSVTNIIGGPNQYLDPTALNQIKNLTVQGGGWLELPGSNVSYSMFELDMRERALRENKAGFGIYLGQNLCYDCYSHDEVVKIAAWIVDQYEVGNSLTGKTTDVRGFSYTGPIAAYISHGCASCVTTLYAPIASPVSYMPYRDLQTFQQIQVNTNHPIITKIGDKDALPTLFGSVTYQIQKNGQTYQYGIPENWNLYQMNPFFTPPKVCQGIEHDGFDLRFNCQ